ncbi:hypothetical protein SAMN05892883_2824 [Jatrophihabitans sp. GAS493]|uniref:hypothetical protein n=1 Tax=Jatrophihabitans sp. GAS493 TaxID=1907575 RepID=UPI000BB69B8A|nr:hypothetical protein [Jatrophihabitans sp. GAS493]SOD73533.1 hypothetical protein SAMN05892883_2824 [Jatrophihabitans sp. GAS493]
MTKLAAMPPVSSTLKGVTVELYGVGATRDTAPAPADWISFISSFATQVCERTKATCESRTQYPSA